MQIWLIFHLGLFLFFLDLRKRFSVFGAADCFIIGSCFCCCYDNTVVLGFFYFLWFRFRSRYGDLCFLLRDNKGGRLLI